MTILCHAPDQVIEALTALDIAMARGRYADWMSGSHPHFVKPGAREFGCMTVHAAQHPLLLQRALPPLPAIPGFDDASQEGPMHRPDAEPDQAKQQGNQLFQIQPIDLVVPPGATAAAVTGPNTGVAWRLGLLCAVCAYVPT